MEMIARVTVRGAKFFRGAIEGKDLDSGKIYVDVDLKGENSFGVCTQELKCEGSKLIDGIKHNPFPFIAEVTMVEKSNGKESTKVVTGIKPLQREAKVA
ncbi:MAG TPA: hypothetical protein VIM12_03125 [Noviherbaspirillum sp.]|jgi:hypothetical protein|uniref:hypothetical protein n=1 Tax=Noviherbaspirillum sp. TaxID=1926288 RepID=UPI002F94B239